METKEGKVYLASPSGNTAFIFHLDWLSEASNMVLNISHYYFCILWQSISNFLTCWKISSIVVGYHPNAYQPSFMTTYWNNSHTTFWSLLSLCFYCPKIRETWDYWELHDRFESLSGSAPQNIQKLSLISLNDRFGRKDEYESPYFGKVLKIVICFMENVKNVKKF